MGVQIRQIHGEKPALGDGMLFVRTESILETMVRIPLIFASLIIVALMMPVQASFGSSRTLDLDLYPDGSVHVSAQLAVDPLEPTLEVFLFGPSIDNFVAVGENGILLSSQVVGDKASVDTFGISAVTINYDVHDLISKEGRVWTFSFDSPSDYSLLMPINSIIVGMNTPPSNVELENDQTKLELASGLSEINYIFGTIHPPTADLQDPPTADLQDPPTADLQDPPTADLQDPPTADLQDPPTGVSLFVPIAIAVSAIGMIVILVKRKQRKPSPSTEIQNIPRTKTTGDYPDLETIFMMRPEMREDDKEIIKFIHESGGQALESSLRKKFLQPRTTMWRAVKRLERHGVIEITKKDMQNLVKLKKDLEEEE